MDDHNYLRTDVVNLIRRLRIGEYSHTSWKDKTTAYVFGLNDDGLDIYMKLSRMDKTGTGKKEAQRSSSRSRAGVAFGIPLPKKERSGNMSTNIAYCEACDVLVSCHIQEPREETLIVRGKEVAALQKHAYCPHCGAEVTPNEIIDYNVTHCA